MGESSSITRLREELARRARGRCEYCLATDAYSATVFQIEHVHPMSRGGSSALENLAYACTACNVHKACRIDALDPISQERVPLFNPRIDSWTAHFRWDGDGARLAGNTPAGRATVEALQLNHRGRVRMRQVLQTMGEHPPAL